MFSDTEKARSAVAPLRRNLVLIVVVVSLIPLALTGFIMLEEFGKAYKAKVFDHLRELVQKHSHSIDLFLNDRLANIRVLSRSSAPENLANSTFLRQKLGLMREEYGAVFVDLGLVDTKGIQVAYAGPFNLTLADYSQAAWFKEALGNELYISDVFAGLRGTPHFIVAVHKKWGNKTYLLKASIDFEAFNALVANIRLGETGFAFILDRQGEFQTKPRFEVILNRGPYNDLLKGKLNPERIPVVLRPDAFGQESIFAMAALKGGEWVLCLQQEAQDAFTHLQSARRMALYIFLISGVIVILVSFLLSRKVLEHIHQAQDQKAVMSRSVIEAGRLASIGELAAGIAHEINNPVAIMVEEAGWIEDLLSDGYENQAENMDEIKRAVGQIRTQGDRCKEITHKLLSFARKTDPAPSQVQVNLLVEEVLGLLTQKTRYANVKLETYLAQGLPPVMASPAELQQVLLNLVNNAVDAIGPGGGYVTVRTSHQDGQVLMEVEDTGEGIPEANLPRIFDPFFTTKPVGQGTGLGLSICYGIVNKLGGTLSLRSNVGQGTSFTVNLPAHGGEAATEEDKTGKKAPTYSPRQA
ncbi:sensor histidine kinase [Dethiosulfatarculus sandiegensis]|uniref:histidine kinase n=1 Tax=Dethiosulfatarculus sandiegensis TaxID=1429043 RepID=A0A0D2GLN4_9BACT|nr:PAS domain-containing sensor histidine kinase [Dethiosulfatarculus sandiegensis]KIX15572.1 histidine kinase [Dethiosulfatarculus sandiegensis]